jgi:hypothetical protein
MKKQDILDTALTLSAVGLGGEVVVRRWLLDQVPSQLSPYLVYGLLTLVVLVAAGQTRRLLSRRQPASSKRTERS